LGPRIAAIEEDFAALEEVARFCAEWEERRDSLDYEIDGVVVKVNSVETQELLGSILDAIEAPALARGEFQKQP
jgi:DNA ligase (NAD+)